MPETDIQGNWFLSTAKVDERQRQRVRYVLLGSAAFFLLAAPFAQVQLPRIEAFLPLYAGALIAISLVVFTLLAGEFLASRRRSVLLLAGSYLFSALMAAAHVLSFPGLFAVVGVIGGGEQTTAWVYFLWHGGFALFLLGFTMLSSSSRDTLSEVSSAGRHLVLVAVAVSVFAGALILLASAGNDSLPPLMRSDTDLPVKRTVALLTWTLDLIALIALWRRRTANLLELWVTASACAWLFDTGLAALLNHARFDVGWYLGRIYGLLAAAFILIQLLSNHYVLVRRLASEHTGLQRTLVERGNDDERRSALALRSGRIAFWNWNIASGGIVWDRGMFDLLGLDPANDEAGFAAWRRAVHPDDLPEAERQITAAIHKHEPLLNRYRIVLRNGEVRWIDAYGDTQYDPQGRPLRMFGVSLDVTPRVEAERQVQLQGEILQCVTDGVIVVSARNGRIIYNNPAFDRMFGYEPGELTGQSPVVLNSLAGGSPEATEAAIMGSLRATGYWEGDLLNRRKDGSSFWTSATIIAHDLTQWGPVWLGVQRDVTDRRWRETKIVQQRSLLDGIMSATDVMLVLFDTAFNFVWVNAAYADTCHMSPEEMVGKNHFALYPHAENEAIFRQVRDRGVGVFFKDRPFAFPDQPERGTTYWDWSLVPTRDAEGQVTGLVFSLRETTKYKMLELELEASEDRYRRLAEQSPDGIFVADASGHYLDVNAAGARMLGYTREEVLQRGITDIIVPEDVVRLPGEMARFTDGSIARSEWQFVRKDGSRFDGEVHGIRCPDGSLQGVLRDITTRKQEDAERLANLTRQRNALITEVHHRIKNHLQGVSGLLEAQIDDHPESANLLNEVMAQIRSIAAVYGLYSATSSNGILLHQIITLLSKGAAGPVAVAYARNGDDTFTLADTDAVPVALVINELITNAMKHIYPADSLRPVRVRLETTTGGAKVTISGGPAQLPDDFDFDRRAGIGIGLELVATLLPAQGAQLSFRQDADEVSAELWLMSPLLNVV